MAKQALIEKSKRHPKFKVRAYNRCQKCGRPRAVFRDFCLCRLCFRNYATKGLLPGIKKASW